MSPLFFALAIDPLLSYLPLLPGVGAEGFADDLAVLSSDPSQAMAIAQKIDDFSRATGVNTSFSKTVLLSASGDGSEWTDELPLTWCEVEPSEFERYLGTFLGKQADVNRVFVKAWEKLTSRLELFATAKSYFNLQGRVTIANIFFIWYNALLGKTFITPLSKVE